MKPTVQWLEYNFDTFNVKYFEGKLPKPKFSLFCKEGDLGNYTPQAEYNTITRKVTKLTGPGVLSIAGQYSRSERDIASTLLHEMIHMYIFTVLRINPRFSHGEKFQEKAEQINRDGFHISEKNELIITDKEEPQKGRVYMVGIITKPQGQNYKLWAFRLEKKFVKNNCVFFKKCLIFRTIFNIIITACDVKQASHAEMAERFKAHDWKSCEVKSLRRFKSSSPRQNKGWQF